MNQLSSIFSSNKLALESFNNNFFSTNLTIFYSNIIYLITPLVFILFTSLSCFANSSCWRAFALGTLALFGFFSFLLLFSSLLICLFSYFSFLLLFGLLSLLISIILLWLILGTRKCCILSWRSSGSGLWSWWLLMWFALCALACWVSCSLHFFCINIFIIMAGLKRASKISKFCLKDIEFFIVGFLLYVIFVIDCRYFLPHN